MGLLIRRRYTLEVAHQLTAGVPERHKCRRLHGHRYEVSLEIAGSLDDAGMLVEYDDLDRVVMPVLKLIDHHSLNDLDQRCSTTEASLVAQNPTVERLTAWIVSRLTGLVASTAGERRLRLAEVSVQEDEMSAAVWREGATT